MKAFRIGLWVAVFALGAFLAYATVNWTLEQPNNGASLTASVGGPFDAVTAKGEPISQADLKGRPHVMFFGFTHCPDVCPTTLYEASQWLKDLGPDGDKVDVYFVSVDPARDTPDALDTYLTAFDPRIQGITGTEEQIAEMMKTYRVFAQKVGDGDDYTINHTASSYLMDADGGFRRTIAYGEDQKVAVEKLRKLIAENS